MSKPMKDDLTQIKALNAQAWALCKKDSSEALQLARQAADLQANCAQVQPIDEFESLRTQAFCLDILSKPGEALPLGIKAKQIAEQIGDKYLIGTIQSILGRIYWHIDDFPTSMDHYLSALKLIQTENHPDLEISLINGLGLVQYGLENFEEALGYFKTCLVRAADDDLNGRAYANNNVAYVLHMLGRDQEALEYGLAGLVLFNQLGTTMGKMETLHTLGAIYFASGDYDQAMVYLSEGIEIARQASCQLIESNYILEISRIHQRRGMAAQAETELLQALEIAEAINSLTNISLIQERLVEIYKQKQDYRLAFEHLEKYFDTYKKLFNDKSDRRVKNLEILHQVEITRKQADLYRELAGTDFLTNLINRRRFFEIAETAFGRLDIGRGEITIMMLDIDFFKAVNDIHGHKIGDEVLTLVAGRIKKSLRPWDYAGRYGGEEFIVLITDTPPVYCCQIAERIRLAVAQEDFQIGQVAVKVTISVGLASSGSNSTLSLPATINCADRAMYQAKQQGRNRSVVWSDH
jgi:diguanylate cyclase (GGDEF)-like protein